MTWSFRGVINCACFHLLIFLFLTEDIPRSCSELPIWETLVQYTCAHTTCNVRTRVSTTSYWNRLLGRHFRNHTPVGNFEGLFVRVVSYTRYDVTWFASYTSYHYGISFPWSIAGRVENAHMSCEKCKIAGAVMALRRNLSYNLLFNWILYSDSF
jgi:hypothetical protein